MNDISPVPIVGQSPGMKRVWRLVRRFAPSDVTIVLQGESGTGKDLFAQVIHHLSPRQAGPFVSLDCATLAESWMGREWFDPSFSDEMRRESCGAGLLDLAPGGTLFLDQIDNLTDKLQRRLLQALQEFEVSPWQPMQPGSFNARIIAATNTDLKEAVQSGTFREALYYQFATVTIELPPLRYREGDIELLCRHFVRIYNERFGKSVAGVSDAVLELFGRHLWPGNVREFENAMMASMLLADNLIRPHHLPKYLQSLSERSTEKNNQTA